jgi:hypothetical protein
LKQKKKEETKPEEATAGFDFKSKVPEANKDEAVAEATADTALTTKLPLEAKTEETTEKKKTLKKRKSSLEQLKKPDSAEEAEVGFEFKSKAGEKAQDVSKKEESEASIELTATLEAEKAPPKSPRSPDVRKTEQRITVNAIFSQEPLMTSDITTTIDFAETDDAKREFEIDEVQSEFGFVKSRTEKIGIGVVFNPKLETTDVDIEDEIFAKEESEEAEHTIFSDDSEKTDFNVDKKKKKRRRKPTQKDADGRTLLNVEMAISRDRSPLGSHYLNVEIDIEAGEELASTDAIIEIEPYDFAESESTVSLEEDYMDVDVSVSDVFDEDDMMEAILPSSPLKQQVSMVVMMPTAETKVTRNIEEEAMEAKARVEETVEATIEAQAAITVPSTESTDEKPKKKKKLGKSKSSITPGWLKLSPFFY